MIKHLLKRAAYILHRVALRLGFHVLPVHTYTPLPNVIRLERNRETWARPSLLPGMSVDLAAQCERLRKICTPFESEFRGNHTYKKAVQESLGPGYGYIEAQALHGVVRWAKPGRVIEVGSGISTACILAAAKRNQEEGSPKTEITCVEPSPSKRLRALSEISLIPEPVQSVPLSLFDNLGRNDLLFIDSTHTVIPGGDVNFLILEVLPRLASGVIVHLHDIFFPYDYQPRVLQTFFHWSETSLLHAFLINNSKVEILFCLSHLNDQRQDVLKDVFPEYDPEPTENGLCQDYRPLEYYAKHFPVSIYLRIL